MLETLDYTIRIGSTPTFLYFDLYVVLCCKTFHCIVKCYIVLFKDISQCCQTLKCYSTTKHSDK